jgi:Asp-tRNA(Asn)/Glu-tRNA(Gln) amidotransferase A subunit family amidase
MPLSIGNPERRSFDSSHSHPRLGHLRGFFEGEASPEVVEHILSIKERLKEAGAIVVDMELPESYARGDVAYRTIHHTELACYHRSLFVSHGDQYPPKIKGRIEEGLTIPGYQYVEALHHRLVFQKEMNERLESFDAAFMPTVPSTAPRGLASTGNPAFCQPWSFCGFPSISIPSGIDNQGLPFAVQLVGLPMREENLIKVASWCEQVLGFNLSPLS